MTFYRIIVVVNENEKLYYRYKRCLVSIYNLFVYFLLGFYDKAEPFYLQCLDVMRSKLGPDHPDTLKSMNNLATLYIGQGSHKSTSNMQLYSVIYESKH